MHGHRSSSSIRWRNASDAEASPWITKVMRGAALKPPSQRMISSASAWADNMSRFLTCARTSSVMRVGTGAPTVGRGELKVLGVSTENLAGFLGHWTVKEDGNVRQRALQFQFVKVK